MKKVFLATSFTNCVDDSGVIQAEFRQKIETILRRLRSEAGVDVFCAVEEEDWCITNSPPEIGVTHDMEILNGSDVLVALLDSRVSAGVQFEIGYWYGKGKPVILAVPAGDELAYYNQGAVSAGWITLITYEDIDSLITQVTVAINAPTEVLS